MRITYIARYVQSEVLFTHEDTMNLILITFPTILLAVVSIWTNDRMYHLAKYAISRLRKKKEPEFHGRHERLEEEEAKVESKHEHEQQ